MHLAETHKLTHACMHRFVLYYTVSVFLVDSTLLWGAFVNFKVYHRAHIDHVLFDIIKSLIIISLPRTPDSSASGALSLPCARNFPAVCQLELPRLVGRDNPGKSFCLFVCLFV